LRDLAPLKIDSISFDELPALITIEEFIAATRVSRAWAYDAARRGLIPGLLRFGRSIRIPKTAINSFTVSK